MSKYPFIDPRGPLSGGAITAWEQTRGRVITRPLVYKGKLSQRTLTLIEERIAMGFDVIIGNDWKLHTRKRWANYTCVLLARTNSRRHGKTVRTVWAVKEAS